MAAGKSTLGAELAARTGRPLLDNDVVLTIKQGNVAAKNPDTTSARAALTTVAGGPCRAPRHGVCGVGVGETRCGQRAPRREVDGEAERGEQAHAAKAMYVVRRCDRSVIV